MLTEISPAGVSAIFERLRSILQDGKINKRCQYTIEKLFKVRQQKFRNNIGVPPELDLVEEEDKITHEICIDDPDLGSKENLQDSSNFFSLDPAFKQNEEEW